MISAHFTGLAAVIAAEVTQARTRIDVAVAWFTDPALFQALVNQAQANTRVTVVVRGDSINFTPPGPGKLDWDLFLAAGGKLYIAPTQAPLHHKFCVVDQQRVISGSYNWTRAARNNQENVLVCDESAVVAAFGREFQALLDRSARVTDMPSLVAAVPPAFDAVAQEATVEPVAEAAPPPESSYDLLVAEAEMAYFQKDYAHALPLLLHALSVAPERVEAYDVLAGLYWRTKQYTRCVAVVEQAEARSLGNPDLWNMAGLGYHGLKDFKQAVRAFDRCIVAAPQHSVWYLNKCSAYDAWSRKSSGDKAASDGRQAASAEIQRYKNGSNDDRLLQAYLVQANLRERPADRQFDARAAKAVFDRMPPSMRDLHHLDQIKSLLRK